MLKNQTLHSSLESWMAFHHFFQLHELLTWWHLNLQSSASKGRIWWQIHSPRNKWMCIEFAWQMQLTGACKRTETDQLLQLLMHWVPGRLLGVGPHRSWSSWQVVHICNGFGISAPNEHKCMFTLIALQKVRTLAIKGQSGKQLLSGCSKQVAQWSKVARK